MNETSSLGKILMNYERLHEKFTTTNLRLLFWKVHTWLNRRQGVTSLVRDGKIAVFLNAKIVHQMLLDGRVG